MTPADRALWTIERHLASRLNLDDLAQVAGVSRHHLVHAFSSRYGVSPMRYARRRQLSLAARRLAEPGATVTAVALDLGFEAPEAFGRAFQAEFVLSPGEVKRRRSVDGLPLLDPMAPRGNGASPVPPPEQRRTEEQFFVGLGAVHEASDPSAIPGQWGRFMQRFHEIEDLADGRPWGLASLDPWEGRLSYACAARVRSRKSTIPRGMTRIVVPGGDVLVFGHRGHVALIRETYAAIWNTWLPDSGFGLRDTPVLEQHGGDFDTLTGEGTVRIWIPVETALVAVGDPSSPMA